MTINWRTSTFCDSGTCIEVGWVASSYCSSGSCVLVSHQDGQILVRDSKRRERSPVIAFTPAGWRAFVDYAPEWDRETQALISGVRISKLKGVVGDVCLSDDQLRHLHYTWEEWDAFVKGAQAGEFAVEVLTRSAPCPTCSGPIRETVGMVCQTCGTDYAPDATHIDGVTPGTSAWGAC